MRRNRRNRGDMIIDLTSLLDVIFIILLVVLGCGYQNNAKLETETKKNEAEKRQIEEARDIYKNAYDTRDFVCIIPISVPYDEDVTKRTIKVPEELGLNNSEFELIGTSEEGYDKFEESLTTYINSNVNRPIILSLNDNQEDILYRDETKMNELITKLSSDHDNVFIKGNISEDKE